MFQECHAKQNCESIITIVTMNSQFQFWNIQYIGDRVPIKYIFICSLVKYHLILQTKQYHFRKITFLLIDNNFCAWILDVSFTFLNVYNILQSSLIRADIWRFIGQK